MERSLYKQRAAGVFEQEAILCRSPPPSKHQFPMKGGGSSLVYSLFPSLRVLAPSFPSPLVLETCARSAGSHGRRTYKS